MGSKISLLNAGQIASHDDQASPILSSLPITPSQTGSLRPKQFPDFKLFYSSKHPLVPFTTPSKFLNLPVFLKPLVQCFIDPLHPDYVCRWLHKGITLFTFHQSDIHLFLLIYVDEMILTGTHLSVITSLIAKIQSKFLLKDLGPH